MDKDIETYLKQLQGALASAGADPALVQDALFDAEEHLQSQMAEGAQFDAVAQAYGSPEEVAAAYLGLPASGVAAPEAAAGSAPEPAEAADPAGVVCPQCGGRAVAGQAYCRVCGAGLPKPPPAGAVAGDTAFPQPQVKDDGYGPGYQPGTGLPGRYGQQTYGAGPQGQYPYGVQSGMAAAGISGSTAAPSVWRDIFGPFADPRVWTSLVYMILSLGTGIAYFTVVVTGISLAGGMMVLIVGVPLLLLVLAIVRGLSLFEGRVVEALLGTRMPRRLRPVPPNVGFWGRIVFWLRDGRTWLSMVYMVLMLPLGIVYFTVAVTLFATSLGLITAPAWGWFGDWTFVYQGITWHSVFPYWGIPLSFVVGVLLLIGTMHAVKWIGRGHAAFAKAMLVRLN